QVVRLVQGAEGAGDGGVGGVGVEGTDAGVTDEAGAERDQPRVVVLPGQPRVAFADPERGADAADLAPLLDDHQFAHAAPPARLFLLLVGREKGTAGSSSSRIRGPRCSKPAPR